MAVNCWVVPLAMPGLVGKTAMETSVAGVIVSIVDPDMPPNAAVIVVAPVTPERASPVLLIVETSVFDDLQLTNNVIFDVVPSEYIPVAVSCWVVPQATLGLVGVISIEISETPALLVPVPPPPLHEDSVLDKMNNVDRMQMAYILFIQSSCIVFGFNSFKPTAVCPALIKKRSFIGVY